jgi:glycosyltransferase involved in cell wall biosynthesis
MVLLEAMSAGMAIITTKETGCADVVGDAALLVKARDPMAIRNALEKLIKKPDLCEELGRAARKRLEDNFNWNKVAIKYVDLYKEFKNARS